MTFAIPIIAGGNVLEMRHYAAHTFNHVLIGIRGTAPVME